MLDNIHEITEEMNDQDENEDSSKLLMTTAATSSVDNESQLPKYILEILESGVNEGLEDDILDLRGK